MPPVGQGMAAGLHDLPSRGVANSSSSIIIVQSASKVGQSALLQPAHQPEVFTAAQPAAALSSVVTIDTSLELGPQHVQSSHLEASTMAVNGNMSGLSVAEPQLVGIDQQQKLPEQMLSQLPAQLSAQLPAQLLAQLPAQLPAQLTAESPSQMPAQLPAHMPAQLMSNLLHMKAQHAKADSSFQPFAVAAEQASGVAAASMPAVTSALQAADCKSFGNQLAAAGQDAASAELLLKSDIGLDTQATAQQPAQPSAQMAAPMAAQVPAQVPAHMPAQTPAQVPAQVLAQLPAQTPAQMPAQLLAQLPTEPHGQLPEILSHMEAHHLKSNTSLASSDIASCWPPEPNVKMVGAVPARPSAGQAADSKASGSQLAATAGAAGGEVAAEVKPLHTPIGEFHTQGVAESAAGCSSFPDAVSVMHSLIAQTEPSAQAAVESGPVLDILSIACEPESAEEAVTEAPEEDEVDTVVRGISGVWLDVNRATACGPVSDIEAVTGPSAEAEIEASTSGVSGVWRDVDSPVSSLNSEETPIPAKDNSSEDLEGFESDHSLYGDSSLSSSSSAHAARSSLGSHGKHGDRQQSPTSDLQTLNMPSESLNALLDDTLPSAVHSQGLQGVHTGLLADAPTETAAPAASPALFQGPAQDALMQQGMAAASARLLVMGSLWGSNLGSLCNLGLILSPSGFILLTSKYEILEIIGEGAYGERLFMASNIAATMPNNATHAAVTCCQQHLHSTQKCAYALQCCNCNCYLTHLLLYSSGS